jgi:hypothetical protein
MALRRHLSMGLLLSFADNAYSIRIVKSFTLQKTYRIMDTALFVTGINLNLGKGVSQLDFLIDGCP